MGATDDNYVPDVVICDPPFATIELENLRNALAAVTSRERISEIPVFIGWNPKREEALYECFGEQRLERKRPLGFMSVKPAMQKHIYLYGPKDVPVTDSNMED